MYSEDSRVQRSFGKHRQSQNELKVQLNSLRFTHYSFFKVFSSYWHRYATK